MYKHEKFELRSLKEIKSDIDAIAAIENDLREISHRRGFGSTISHEAAVELIGRVPQLEHHQGFAMVYHWLLSGGKTAFLQDANSLIMKTDQLVEALQYLRQTFPSISRVTSYVRSKTLAQKKPAELEAIRRAGLDRLHVGLETGDDTLLKQIQKGVTAAGHIQGGRKALEAGFQLSEYWMPGLGGTARSDAHARETARTLNHINPHYIRSRPLRPIPGTPLHASMMQKTFKPLSPKAHLYELKLMVSELNVTSKVCFDHAGNYWKDRQGNYLFSHSYEGYRFPEEKQKVLALIEKGLSVKT
jgi:radical SAM superfamily enzyme YgiQ (UPF0313 family)